ncbi:hypothetical protein FVE85_2992 [Porphyridium purpureum]|uniref:Uncharacterized protein n=1 Tax=Porphyridium purpureum TaxID=35688 RepID=A0A5J4YTC1_PORPP|nr:hypothetical protein FVE85_2992 [Porphyridium purpureum]|eukprot:POR2861..scf227_4
MQTFCKVAPLVAGGALAAYMAFTAVSDKPVKKSWVAPAVASAGFLGYSILTVVKEGPMGFWIDHTRDLWGVQIWMDLLLSVAVGWTLMMPRAKKVDMNLPFWGVLTLLTGNIGFLGALARLLFLEENAKPYTPVN